MNFEKLTLIRLLRTKDSKFLLSLADNLFIRPMNRTIFKAIKNYYKRYGKIPSSEVLAEAIKVNFNDDKAEKYTGMLEWFELYEGELPSNEELYQNLKDAYVLFQIDDNIEKLVESAKNKDIPEIKKLINTIQGNAGHHHKTPENIFELEYLPSKIRTIDSSLLSMRNAGLKMGGLVIVGGTSGGGKSIFTLQQLMYSYSVNNLDVCLLNMELSTDETIARMYSHATQTDFSKVYGNSEPEMVAKVNSWKQKYFGRENEFRMKSVRYSISEIEAVVRQQAADGIVLFGIDYLQIIDSDSSIDEWKQLRDLVRLLHQLTLELQIVIVSPVQINFSDTSLKDNELKVTVRGSKELEFSSSVFLFIYQNTEEYNENMARIFTVKARNAKKNIYVVQTDFNHMVFNDTGVIL
jgi:replicative DNA helicase